LIAVMNNGEDLNGHPEPHIVGYMIKHKIPLALVTTERTRTDVKGGIIVLGKDKDGIVTENLFEVALARTKEQQELFSKMGIEIRNEGQDARMSNNHVFVNYDALIPQIEKLKKHLNLRSDTEFEREFFKMLVPNLITNSKKKKLAGEEHYQNYIQLESSMGDAILNFDSQWRKIFREPILTCFHFDRFERTKIFTPLKNAFDFLMLYNSDRFTLNKEKMELIDNNAGALPEIVLLDPETENRFYQNVKNVLDSFLGVSLLNLDSLSISGQIIMKKAILKGKVNIQNDSSENFNVDEYFKDKSGVNGSYILENILLTISSDGKVIYS
jgi:UDP-N-acetylglucosamine pyrophosphorylase